MEVVAFCNFCFQRLKLQVKIVKVLFQNCSFVESGKQSVIASVLSISLINKYNYKQTFESLFLLYTGASNLRYLFLASVCPSSLPKLMLAKFAVLLLLCE